MKKALIIRYSAYGDAIHASHLPRLLKESGYSVVDVETNPKGLQIFAENPHIDNLSVFDNFSPNFIYRPYSWLQKRWEVLSQGYDKVVNLTNSIEYGAIAMEDQNIYYQSDRVRREAFGNINYYDIAIDWAGLPKELHGTTGEMYFKDSEVEVVENWVKKYEGKFKVLINLSGTSLHKIFINAKAVSEEIIRKYPDAVVMLTGDVTCKPYDFSKEIGCVSMVGKNAIRHVILLAKYMDCVIGCESGLMVASNMWGTPTIQLLTAANHNNHPKYAENDYSMQSNIRCSPCHKGPYKYIGCPKTKGYPACIYGFPTKDILNRVEHIYASR